MKAARWTRVTVRIGVLTMVASLFFGTASPADAAPHAGWPVPNIGAWLDHLAAVPVKWQGLPRQASGRVDAGYRVASAASTRAHQGTGHKPGVGKGQLRPAPGAVVPKRVSGPSAPAFVGFNAGTSRRIAAKSSATASYYANADGSYTKRFSMTPVNYKDATGAYQPIDTSVVKGADRRWQELANSLAVSFGPYADDPAAATLALDASHSISYTLAGAAHVAGVASESTVTYAGVAADTDLTAAPTATGMEQSVVLHSATAANAWTYDLNLHGLRPVLRSDGSIDLVNAAGTALGVILPAHATDAGAAYTDAVGYRLQTAGGVSQLVVTLDPTWLHDPSRVFPVTVDPTTKVATAYGTTTYAESGAGNTGDHSTATTIKVGSPDAGTTKAVGYVQFPGAGLDKSAVTVSSAVLTLKVNYAGSCTAQRLDVAAVTAAWTPASVTAYPGPAYGASIGSNTTTTTPTACVNSTHGITASDPVNITVATATVQGWANGTSVDNGLAIYAATTSTSFYKEILSGADYLDRGPVLTVTYTGTVLPQLLNQAPANGTVATTLTPTLSALGTVDQATAAPKYVFSIFDTSGVLVKASNALTTNGWTVPAGKLRWGQTYYWQVQVTDGTLYSPNPVAYALTINPPQPAVTGSISQTDDNHGFDPQNGNYSTSATDADVSTIGPALSIIRDYNSRDPRTSGAFGAAWSSILDAKATELVDDSGTVTSVIVTYPDGSEVGFGRNSNGSFAPPMGRSAKLIDLWNGYELIDTSNTTYTFTQALGSGVYGLFSVADGNQHLERIHWTGNSVDYLKAVVSNRILHLTWQTPAGAQYPHIATVTTDDAVDGQDSTAGVWTYNYAGDELTSVCPPGAAGPATGCTVYGYGSQTSPYRNRVLDTSPQSFWPLAETSGTVAKSAVIGNQGADNGTYANVTLGQPGPLAGGAATAAGFNGTSSYVSLPDLHMGTSLSQSISLWFKAPVGAPAGMLYSYTSALLTEPNPIGHVTPTLYLGSNGQVYGSWWTSATLMNSTAVLADGQWHHVVLAGSTSGQAMYVDGVLNATAAGVANTASKTPWNNQHNYLGAGFLTGTYPSSGVANDGQAHLSYFQGSIADVAFSPSVVSAADAAGLYQAGRHATNLLTTITNPSGRAFATITYDGTTGQVTALVDDNGGTWNVNPTTVTGSSQVYRSAVLGTGPQIYDRLGDAAGSSAAYNEVASGNGTYANATLGVAGPFADQSAAAFNGTSSRVQLPSNAIYGAGPTTVSMWFNTTHANGILFSYEHDPITSTTTTANYVPALYVGNDGKVGGEYIGITQILSPSTYIDGKWHYVVLTTSGTQTTMYIDGAQIGTKTGTMASPQTNTMGYDYVGAGLIGGSWPDSNKSGVSPAVAEYFNGSIAEFSYTHTQLSATQVAGLYQAGKNSAGLSPMTTVSFTDPGGHTITDQFDTLNGNRQIAEIDGTGAKTSFGYDTSGFLYTVTNPDGDVTTTGHDADGNVVSRTTCQNQAANLCSTEYMTYQPNTQGTDLASGGTVTASTSTVATGWALANLSDGVTTSTSDAIGFESGSFTAAANTTSAQIDMGAVKSIDQVDLYGRNDAGNIGVGFPQNFTIDVSTDNTTWTTVATATGAPQPLNAVPKSMSFLATSARYVRVTATLLRPVGTGYMLQLAEMAALNDTPDPLAGELLTARDGRSSGPGDNMYLTSYGYDAAGDNTTTTTPPVAGFPAGRTTTIAYADGTTIPAANPGFVPAGLPYQTTTPGGAVTTVHYFHNGDVADTVTADGLVTAYTYDELGRVLTKTVTVDSLPQPQVTSYVYSATNQVLTETDPPVTDAITGAVHTAVTTSTYDADGNLTLQTVSDSTGGDASRSTGAHYNAYGEMDTQTDGKGQVTSLTYDGYGNKVTSTDPAGTITTDTYDANGNVLTQTLTNYTGDPVSPTAAAPLVESSRVYDPAGRLASIQNAMGYWTLYTYTDDGLVATVTRTDQNKLNPFVDKADTYDGAGNIVKEVTNNGATTTLTTLDAAARPTLTTLDPTGVAKTTITSYTPDDLVASTARSDTSGILNVDLSTYSAGGAEMMHENRTDSNGLTTAWWPLTETGGPVAYDHSGLGMTAGRSATGVSWAGAGGGATLNGSTGYFATSGPIANTSANYTISLWVNLASLTTNQVFAAQSGTNTSAYALMYSTTKGWVFQTSSADVAAPTWTQALNPATPVTGAWTHLFGVYDNDNDKITLYVNGVAGTSVAFSAGWNATHAMQIGRDGGTSGTYGSYTNGTIENVAVSAYALDAGFDTVVYNAGRSGVTDPGSLMAPLSTVTSWTRDQRGLPTSVTAPGGSVTTDVYDAAGQLTTVVQPAVSVTTDGVNFPTLHPITKTGYNTFGDAVESEDADGNIVTTVYDANDRPVSRTLPAYTAPGTAMPIVATTVDTYDSAGNVVDESDALTRDTHYVFDQLGDLAQVTTPDGHSTHVTYDLNGDALTVTDPAGIVHQATYDALGRPKTATVLERYPTPLVSTTTMSYAASAANPGGAWLAKTTSQNNVATSYTYNNIGQTTAVLDPAGNTTQYTYSVNDRNLKITRPDGTSSDSGRDSLGRVVSTDTKDASGVQLSAQSFTYNPSGTLKSENTGSGGARFFFYDAADRLYETTQYTNSAWVYDGFYSSDADGHRTEYTDGRGYKTISTYNVWNLPESTIEPSAGSYTSAADRTSTTAYDADGEAVTHTDPGGITFTTGYDLLGDVTSQSGAGADAATATRTFGYDLDGRLTSASTTAAGPAPATADAFTYDDRNDPLTATGTSGASSFTYNADSLMTSRTDAAGTTTYGYDTAGRLQTLADPSTGITATIAYNTLSRPLSITYGTGGDVRAFTYDSSERLATDTLKSGATVIGSIAYGYDGGNNLTSKNTTGAFGTVNNTYTYDGMNRLASWVHGTTTVNYGYDSAGNRTQVGSAVYTYNSRDELTSDGVNTYTYTARGTLQSQSGPGGTVASTSDAFGQAITQGVQTYTHDAMGRVLAASGGTNTTFTYTGMSNTIASDGTSTYSYDPSGAAFGVKGTGYASLQWADQHSDVVAQFTPTGTATSGTETYDPLGNVLAKSGINGGLGYQSGWTDPSTNRVNMLTRWYNPAVGQFNNHDITTQSPSPNPIAGNPFAYVDDNPLAGTDPNGECSWYNVVCDAGEAWNGLTHAASAAWGYVKSSWNAFTSWAGNSYKYLERQAEKAARQAKRLFDKSIHCVSDMVACGSKIVHRATRTIGHVYRAAKPLFKASVHAVKTAAHAAAHVAKRAATFAAHHAGAIAAFVVSTAAFIGCDAAIGLATGGVGAIAGTVICSGLSGALGGLAVQDAKCLGSSDGSKCSLGKLARAGLIGGITGAAAGLGFVALGSIGGKALSAIGGVLRDAGTEASDGIADGIVSETRWTGSGPAGRDWDGEAAKAYEKVRALTDDVDKISENLGVSKAAVSRARNNLFIDTHTYPTGPTTMAVDERFVPQPGNGELWLDGYDDVLTDNRQAQLRALIAHEDVEGRLMDAGLPYRVAGPASYDAEGVALMLAGSAHDIAPNPYIIRSADPWVNWPKMGLDPSGLFIAPDLSNLDSVTAMILEKIGWKS